MVRTTSFLCTKLASSSKNWSSVRFVGTTTTTTTTSTTEELYIDEKGDDDQVAEFTTSPVHSLVDKIISDDETEIASVLHQMADSGMMSKKRKRIEDNPVDSVDCDDLVCLSGPPQISTTSSPSPSKVAKTSENTNPHSTNHLFHNFTLPFARQNSVIPVTKNFRPVTDFYPVTFNKQAVQNRPSNLQISQYVPPSSSSTFQRHYYPATKTITIPMQRTTQSKSTENVGTIDIVGACRLSTTPSSYVTNAANATNVVKPFTGTVKHYFTDLYHMRYLNAAYEAALIEHSNRQETIRKDVVSLWNRLLKASDAFKASSPSSNITSLNGGDVVITPANNSNAAEELKHYYYSSVCLISAYYNKTLPQISGTTFLLDDHARFVSAETLLSICDSIFGRPSLDRASFESRWILEKFVSAMMMYAKVGKIFCNGLVDFLRRYMVCENAECSAWIKSVQEMIDGVVRPTSKDIPDQYRRTALNRSNLSYVKSRLSYDFNGKPTPHFVIGEMRREQAPSANASRWIRMRHTEINVVS